MVAVVPARNEADVIERSVGSLLAQDYPAHFASCWSTTPAKTAPRRARAEPGRRTRPADRPHRAPAARRLDRQALGGRPGRQRPPGAPTYLWITDADIAHDPQTLRRLVARAEAGGLALVSLMARLQTGTWPSGC